MNSPIVLEQFVKVSPAKVWQALTDKETMKEWYFDIPDFELKEGAVFNFYEGEAKAFHHQCTIKSIVREKAFSHTWTHPSHSKGVSLLTWELFPKDDGTLVRLTHTDTENFADAGSDFSKENFETGWKGIFQSNLKNYLYGIKKLIFQEEINAPASKVWQALWDKTSFKLWTTPFNETSHYKGEIKSGERIHFLDGEGNGMYSDAIYIVENKYAAFCHLGNLKNGVEQAIDDETERWTKSLEQYFLSEKDGITTLKLEMDCPPKNINYINGSAPKALAIVKQLAEN